MNIFFCDIIGTFYEKGIDESNIQKLIQNIVTLSDIDNIDKTIFSFVCSEDMEYVTNFVEKLKHFLNDRVILGMQFSSDNIMYQDKLMNISNGSKIEQILYALKKTNNVENVYFADDALMNHLIINDLLNELYPNMKVINIVPGTVINEENIIGTEERGLVGVNKILNTYIEKTINSEKKQSIL